MRFRREYAVCVFAAAAFRITAGFAEGVHLRAPGEGIAQIYMIRNIFSNVLVMNVAGRKLNVNRISQCVRHCAREKPRRAARVAPETLCGTLIRMFFLSFARTRAVLCFQQNLSAGKASTARRYSFDIFPP